MVIELEIPNSDLIGQELKMKVSMRTDGYYFMLSNKYKDCTSVNDPRIQTFYKQLFSSIALQEEDKVFFGKHGIVKKSKKQ